jgi:homoserine kinase
VSGAGPSILAFGTASGPVDAARWKRPGWRAVDVAIDADGARTVPESPAG